MSAEVVVEQGQGQAPAKKHIGNVKYEEFSFEAGFSMAKGMYNWISDSVDGNAGRRNGAIILADFDYKERSKRSFYDALITEITFPACDAASGKDPAYLILKVKPESVRDEKTGGGTVTGPVGKKQKQWLPANFRLSIPGVDCTRVKKIESFTIKQNVSSSSVGDVRDYQIEPARVEYPNLRITVPVQFAGDFMKWHEDFVIKGNSGDDQEKKECSLSLLSADLKEEIAKVTCFQMGISRLEQKTSKGEGLDCVIDLYVERMEVDFMAQFEK